MFQTPIPIVYFYYYDFYCAIIHSVESQRNAHYRRPHLTCLFTLFPSSCCLSFTKVWWLISYSETCSLYLRKKTYVVSGGKIRVFFFDRNSLSYRDEQTPGRQVAVTNLVLRRPIQWNLWSRPPVTVWQTFTRPANSYGTTHGPWSLLRTLATWCSPESWPQFRK